VTLNRLAFVNISRDIHARDDRSARYCGTRAPTI
jgi:hypothetical protein